MSSELNTTQTNIDAWNDTLIDSAKEFEVQSINIADNITLSKGRLDDKVKALQGKLRIFALLFVTEK